LPSPPGASSGMTMPRRPIRLATLNAYLYEELGSAAIANHYDDRETAS